jgi:hypothetical protein
MFPEAINHQILTNRRKYRKHCRYRMWFNKLKYTKTMIVPFILKKCYNLKHLMSQPHFGQVWGWSPTLGKVGSWSPPGLSNVQSLTARGKTPRIGVLLVSLERSWNINIENGLALAIWTSTAQVMGKRRAGSQTGKP